MRGDVSAEQRAALTAAAEMRYFGSHGTPSIEDVADDLDSSSQAVSERLRQGTGTLVRDVLQTEPIGVPY